MKFHILCWALMLAMLAMITGVTVLWAQNSLPTLLALGINFLLAAGAWIFATEADRRS